MILILMVLDKVVTMMTLILTILEKVVGFLLWVAIRFHPGPIKHIEYGLQIIMIEGKVIQ